MSNNLSIDVTYDTEHEECVKVHICSECDKPHTESDWIDVTDRVRYMMLNANEVLRRHNEDGKPDE